MERTGILLPLVLAAISTLSPGGGSVPAADAPKVVWSSDPVLPNETVAELRSLRAG